MKLGIRYLTGYSSSFDPATQQAEWPPHPARVFMAMAAAHFETAEHPKEREALEWLEVLPPPTIHASDVDMRSRNDVFVCVNDSASGIVNRSRQARQFPKCRPHNDTVYLSWDHEAPAGVVEGLESVCSKVTRIGHSSSLVQMWVERQALDNTLGNWCPSKSDYNVSLRVTDSGFLEYLEDQFNGNAISEYFDLQHRVTTAKGKSKQQLREELNTRFPAGPPQSVRPVVPSWHGYRSPDLMESSPEITAEGPFDSDIIVIPKIEGNNLGVSSTLHLTGALRNAVMKHGPQPPPEWVSGHTPDEKPTRSPHLAFFPLPFVGTKYADGHIMGLAIAVPRSLPGVPGDERSQAIREQLGPLFFDEQSGNPTAITLCRKNRDNDNGYWSWTLQLDRSRSQSAVTLKPSTWTQPSFFWASVTPIVLHHYPKRGIDDVERILRESFVSAGFPEPESLKVIPVSYFDGAGHHRELPLYSEGGDDLCRYHTHVCVKFRTKVSGPMLVGRGRFRGYGLMRPYVEERQP